MRSKQMLINPAASISHIASFLHVLCTVQVNVIRQQLFAALMLSKALAKPDSLLLPLQRCIFDTLFFVMLYN